MALFSNPAKDAKKIQNTIDYRVLKAAWDCYATINAGSLSRTHKTATPAWYALFAIQNYNGNFKKFDIEELHLLKSLTTVNTAYDEIIASLESYSDNTSLARHILNTHPNLKDAVPPEYDNVDKINGYIISVIKKYKFLLSEFYAKYENKINATIQKLEATFGHATMDEEINFDEDAD